MTSWQQLLADRQHGRLAINNLFLDLCPLITEQNVGHIWASIPVEDILQFRWYVAYSDTRPTVVIQNSPPIQLGREFERGLLCLRNFLDTESPLHLGDHLLIEKADIERVLCGMEHHPKNRELNRRLSLIDELLVWYPPRALSSFATL